MAIDVQKTLETNDQLKRERKFFEPIWQLVSEFCLARKVNFTASNTPGDFLSSNIWTAIPAKSLETAASALIGLVWPDSQSFKLEPFGDLKNDKESQAFFDNATKELQASMDDPGAGLALALDEFMTDALAFGTPAIHLEEGDATDFKFDAWNVSQYSIDEGDDGYVDTFYKEREYTIRQAVKKWGKGKLSKRVQELYDKKCFGDKIKVLHVIAPRDVNPNLGAASNNLPIASVYIEIDTSHVIKESGFHELPTFCFRYSKRIGEKYGRSPAMRALPDIMELNSLWEIITLGLEKNFDPPLAILDDGSFGSGTIDTSAGAISVLNISGKIAKTDPIKQLQTVGSFNDVAVLVERLEDTVKDHFMIDRLLDLNNETTMTAREALLRNSIRQSTLRSFISRVTNELFNRLIERGFNMLLRKGRFGFVAGSPEAVAWQATHPGEDMKIIPAKVVAMQGKQERAYRIKYMTPAAREQQSEAAQGILNLFQFTGEVAKTLDPTAKDELNVKRAIRILGDIWAVPEGVYNTDDEYKAIAESRNNQASDEGALEQGAAMSGIAKNMAQAHTAMRSTT